MPLQSTSGAASYDAFGGGVAVVPKYIEDVFSTFLWSGNGSAITINNGIDLSTKGGLVWVKARNQGARNHWLQDTARGITNTLNSDTTGAQNALSSNIVSSVTTTGFVDGASWPSGWDMASWSWAKAPKFFDVVTYTGTGGSLTVNHNLGSTPGCIIVKRINSTSDWFVHHQDVNYDGSYLKLNSTAANNSGSVPPYFLISVTDTYFTMQATGVANVSGATYVAYIFAHNAGGFGLTGTDNVISCGSWTGTGSGDYSGPTVDLGYEPQLILFKNATASAGDTEWNLYDNMRGLSMSASQRLMANSSSAEVEIGPPAMQLNATGFKVTNGAYSASGQTYIYIAIRRGPMKVPTSGTKVFAPVVSSVSDGTQITSGFPVDMQMFRYRAGTVSTFVVDRLRGVGTTTTAIANPQIRTNLTTAETNTTGVAVNWNNTGFAMPTGFGGVSDIFWNFQRAPSFFDVVCYTGGVSSNPSHNLGVTPEMYIVKCRSSGTSDRGWYVYHTGYDTANNYILMNSSAGLASLSGVWSSGPTSTTFGVANGYAVNDSGQTYVTYLFATCAGVSKVGSFSYATGSSTNVDCGFTSGARFVMIKQTDGVDSWYVFDTARGIVAGNDPAIQLNSAAAELTGFDIIDPYSAGFTIPAGALGTGTFIFLAIA